MTTDFYIDLRFCTGCRKYVSYLESVAAAYCIECGDQVRLFSPADMSAFRASALRGLRSNKLPVPDKTVA